MHLPHFVLNKKIILQQFSPLSFIFVVLSVILLFLFLWQQSISQQLTKQTLLEKSQTANAVKSLNNLKSQNQYKINQTQQAEINHIHTSYANASKTYESLTDLKQTDTDTGALDTLYAQVLSFLSDKNYASADADLTQLNSKIQAAVIAETPTLAPAAAGGPSTETASNSLPSDGHSRQKVHTDAGDFVVDIIAGNLSSTKVVVDTASSSDCSNNCPVLPLASFVSRNGAYAGINGSYFCPADYPSCAGKTNSFDLLLMNKDKKYFNSGNNVYSTNPAVIFGSGFVRFVSQASQWGRDTSVDGVISNYPLLVSGGSVVYGGSSDPKMGSVGPRSFVANKGNTVYIGYVYNATMTESAHVMKALGVDNAMNLDEGGSTALWFGGSYLAGPGRDLANAVLFIRK